MRTSANATQRTARALVVVVAILAVARFGFSSALGVVSGQERAVRDGVSVGDGVQIGVSSVPLDVSERADPSASSDLAASVASTSTSPPTRRKLRESIVGDAVKSALAEAIRGKAESKAGSGLANNAAATAASSVPSAATKEFSYTSIKFKSSDSTESPALSSASEQTESSFIEELARELEEQERREQQLQAGVPVATPLPSPPPSPTDTQQQQFSPPRASLTASSDIDALESQLNAKLAAIQQEMGELEQLKLAIAQLEGNLLPDTETTRKLQMLNDKFEFAPMPTMPRPFEAQRERTNAYANQAKSRLNAKYPDTGIPGWDPLKLLNEKNAFIQDNTFQLQRNSAEKAARVNTLMTDALAMGADSIATIVGRGGDMQVVQNDMVRSFLDALVLQAQGKMGQLQQFFLDLMDRKERKVVQVLNKIY